MEPAEKVRVALVYGGRSGEHDISRLTAGCVFAAADPAAYDLIPVGIDRSGEWLVGNGRDLLLEDGSLALPEAEMGRGEALDLLASVDVVFPLLHGPLGEDGTIQGLCEILGVRYVGAGVLSSALCMDKHFTKMVLAQVGLPVVPWVCVTAGEELSEETRENIDTLGLPLFVKPSRAGSSLGITKVDAIEDLPAALEEAGRHDTKILIESLATGREVECAVLDTPEGPRASDIGEICFESPTGFYDYDRKYIDTDALELKIPAEIDEAERMRMREMTLRAYRAVDGEGMARVDYFYDDGDIVISEINTIPGFTPFSMYPLLWEESGLDYSGLIAQLIEQARGRVMAPCESSVAPS